MILKIDVAMRNDKRFQNVHDKMLRLPNYREYTRDNELRCEIMIESAYDFLLFYEDAAELYKKVIKWKCAEVWILDRYIESPISISFKGIEEYVRNKFANFPSQTVLGQAYEQWVIKL